jgi:hypothetical protein
MCDRTIHGRPIDFQHGLKIIAAVNPYRKHSEDMIRKLESAGLGFYLSSSDTKEKLGHIPMRELVYRVQPLPTSMIPLVWDFGQLGKSIEGVYIRQMVINAITAKKFVVKVERDREEEDEVETDSEAGEKGAKVVNLVTLSENYAKKVTLLCDLLKDSQEFMRSHNDECSFVSMRDIDRCIKVTVWFLSKYDLIFTRMDDCRIKEKSTDPAASG